MREKGPLDDYSAIVLHHMHNPRNWGIIDNSDGYGRITGTCGDTMEISLRVKGDVITHCTFDTDGCGATVACGSIVTELVTGMTVAEAMRIDGKAILSYCQGLPRKNEHCADLAVNTLHKALGEYRHTKAAPWKKLYRTHR